MPGKRRKHKGDFKASHKSIAIAPHAVDPRFRTPNSVLELWHSCVLEAFMRVHDVSSASVEPRFKSKQRCGTDGAAGRVQS